jgi:hypothetical protein
VHTEQPYHSLQHSAAQPLAICFLGKGSHTKKSDAADREEQLKVIFCYCPEDAEDLPQSLQGCKPGKKDGPI